MKKIISTLLIFSSLSCFTMTVGSFASSSMDDSNSPIISIWDEIKFGFGTTWNGTKYGAEKAWNGTKYGLGKAWDGTKYGAETAWNGTKYGLGKAWNGTKYGVETAWDYTKYGLEKAWNSTKNLYCNHIGWGCENSIGSNEQVDDQLTQGMPAIDPVG